MTDTQIFETITGVIFTPEFLKLRKRENLDLRDIFVNLVTLNGTNKEFNRVAKLINKDRSTIRVSRIRFKNLYETDKNYRLNADEIKHKFEEYVL